MTFSNQEVPTWDVYDNDMYDDLQLPIQDGQHFLEQTEIKTEDPYSPYVCQVCEVTENWHAGTHFNIFSLLKQIAAPKKNCEIRSTEKGLAK